MNPVWYYIAGTLYIAFGLAVAGIALEIAREKELPSPSALTQWMWIFLWPLFILGRVVYRITR